MLQQATPLIEQNGGKGSAEARLTLLWVSGGGAFSIFEMSTNTNSMKRVGVFGVVCAWVLAGCGAERARGDSSSVSSSVLPPEAQLTIAHVKDTYIDDSVLVHAVHVRIDGHLVESCQLEELEDDVCGRDIPLAPGPHRVAIGISCRNAETLGYSHPNGDPCDFTLEEGIVVGFRERLELDLGRASRDPEHYEDALIRQAGPAPDTDCLATLETLAAADTCTADGFTRAAQLARRAQAQCADIVETSHGGALLAEASSAHLNLRPGRCLPTPALRDEIPQLLTSGYSDWPGRSLPEGTSTWSWVRASLIPQANLTPQAELEALAPALTESAKRAVVFDQLTAVFSPKADRDRGQKRAIEAALATPFSLDPRTVEGHRNFVLMASETYTAAYQDFIARGVMTTERIHCDRHPLARQLSLFFTRQGLSRPEWEAVQAMMTRTPKESRVHDCDYAFREDNEGNVPLAERLEWLFQFDCDPRRRHPTLLGDRVEVHLDPDTSTPPELRTLLLSEFNSCLTTRCQRQSCSWFPGR